METEQERRQEARSLSGSMDHGGRMLCHWQGGRITETTDRQTDRSGRKELEMCLGFSECLSEGRWGWENRSIEVETWVPLKCHKQRRKTGLGPKAPLLETEAERTDGVVTCW